jgi:hypothetical protein
LIHQRPFTTFFSRFFRSLASFSVKNRQYILSTGGRASPPLQNRSVWLSSHDEGKRTKTLIGEGVELTKIRESSQGIQEKDEEKAKREGVVRTFIAFKFARKIFSCWTSFFQIPPLQPPIEGTHFGVPDDAELHVLA